MLLTGDLLLKDRRGGDQDDLGSTEELAGNISPEQLRKVLDTG